MFWLEVFQLEMLWLGMFWLGTIWLGGCLLPVSMACLGDCDRDEKVD
jgi:hypothetical protein